MGICFEAFLKLARQK